jgi:hypothetical protein
MKTSFFSVSQNASRLQAAAAAWVGTPFHSRITTQGKGISCVSLIFELCVETGVADRSDFAIPHGLVNWHLHNDFSLIDNFLRSDRVKELIKRKDVEDGVETGDLLPLRTSATVHHLCIMIDPDHFVHCHRKKGVMIASLQDVKRFLTPSIYRIYK